MARMALVFLFSHVLISVSSNLLHTSGLILQTVSRNSIPSRSKMLFALIFLANPLFGVISVTSKNLNRFLPTLFQIFISVSVSSLPSELNRHRTGFNTGLRIIAMFPGRSNTHFQPVRHLTYPVCYRFLRSDESILNHRTHSNHRSPASENILLLCDTCIPGNSDNSRFLHRLTKSQGNAFTNISDLVQCFR